LCATLTVIGQTNDKSVIGASLAYKHP